MAIHGRYYEREEKKKAMKKFISMNSTKKLFVRFPVQIKLSKRAMEPLKELDENRKIINPINTRR